MWINNIIESIISDICLVGLFVVFAQHWSRAEFPADMSFTEIAMRYKPQYREDSVRPLQREDSKFVKWAREVENIGKEVSAVHLVQKSLFHNLFLTRRAEYDSREIDYTIKTLYHDTAASNIDSILMTNLNWRKVCRDKFGRGVSFANTTRYANCFSNFHGGNKRAMIVAKVLVGKESQGRWNQALPKDGCDTTIGNDAVYVKYYDDEFYPKYIIYYDDQGKGNLNQTE